MLRYIAFAWNHEINERASLARSLCQRLKAELPDWKCALATDGLQVYHVGDQAPSSRVYVLKRTAGVVLGKVFRRRDACEGSPHEAVFDEDESRKVQESGGRHLIDGYWGRYVALLRRRGGLPAQVLRDPTGAMPCFLTRFRGIDVVCSEIYDCVALGILEAGINWDHVATYLWFQNIVTQDTGLHGVRQVLAGEGVSVGGRRCSRTASFLWTPDRLLAARVLDNRREAMHELRSTVEHCVSAWSSCYSTILHSLSGGLDSAVVLACLSRASGGANVICENYFTRDTRGDERSFAREAARRAGIELIETPLRPAVRPLQSMLNSKKVATPTLTRLVPQVESIRERLIKTRGIEAVFSGQGGDHLFQEMKTPLIAAEYAWRHGLRSELFKVIAETSRFTKRSVWSVTRDIFISGLLKHGTDPYRQFGSPPFGSSVTQDPRRRARMRHSWIDNASNVPGSKIFQIFNIIDSQSFYWTRYQYVDSVHPLISQPIIELCLQIPCYVLTYDGIDRALVRDAFASVVPPRIIRRTIKGGTTSYVNGLLVKNLPSLRAYLLGGLLVGRGLLDRDKTEAALTEANLVRDRRLLFPVLNAVRAESWLRTWISDSQDVAA